MRHIILEVFDQAMMAQNAQSAVISASLEAFEEEKRLEYLRGRQEGYNEAMQTGQFGRQQGHELLMSWLSQEASQAKEIRHILLQQMRPLFEGVIENVLPMAAKISLVPLAVDHLLTRVQAEVPDKIYLSVHPEDFAEIEPFIMEASIELIKDEGLMRGRYGLKFDDLEATFDIGRVCHEVTELIRAFFAIEPERGCDD